MIYLHPFSCGDEITSGIVEHDFWYCETGYHSQRSTGRNSALGLVLLIILTTPTSNWSTSGDEAGKPSDEKSALSKPTSPFPLKTRCD